MIFKKKGMSDVVANMLIILLTITSVVIVANIVIPFVNRSLESTSCFEYRDYFKFDESFGYNCFDESNDRYLISIKTDSNSEKVEGFSLRFLEDGGSSSTIIIKNNTISSEVKMLEDIANGKIIIPGEKYSALTYNYSSNLLYDRVEVYPMIRESKICDLSDSIKLIKCG